jgi:hypothetical protein
VLSRSRERRCTTASVAAELLESEGIRWTERFSGCFFVGGYLREKIVSFPSVRTFFRLRVLRETIAEL